MHYVGMAAVHFSSEPLIDGSLQHAISVSRLGLASIVSVTFVLLGIVCVTSLVERRMFSQGQELAESRVQLQTVFDNMSDGLIVWNREAKLVTLNRAATELLGLSNSPAVMQHPEQTFDYLEANGDLLPFEFWPGVRALRGDFLRNSRLAVRRKDTGKTVHVEVNTAPITNHAGEISQVIVTYRDITERHLLDEAQARLVAIVESSEDAIIGKSDKGIITSWNRGAKKIFGYTSEEMVGDSILKLLPSDRKQEESVILDRLKRGETVDHFETVRVKKDGSTIHVSLTISPIYDGNGTVVGASKIARDITDRMALEQQLRQSQKMEAVGQLTGGIAHDFNNLLGVVIGNLDLLERLVAADEKALQRVKTAQKASLRGADLTRRLLAFSSNRPLSPTKTKLHHCIRNVMEMSNRVIGPEIKLVTNFDGSISDVFVDSAGLESALLNLVVNARDAMPRGGTITIATKKADIEETYVPVQTADVHAGAFVCISVTDTGEGMSRETVERAFEPFYTTKPRGKGTGLGLAMVYGFVKQSGGTTRIYSELGFGTTVAFYLPLPFASDSGSDVVRPEVMSFKTGGTVLVVDDEEDLLEIAVAYLTDLGFQTLRATDGASALEIVAERNDLELLMTDILMPGGMSGVEMAQNARQLNPRLKVVYSSGFPADALTERGMSLADCPMLHKPYQRAEFCALIARLMNSTADTPSLSERKQSMPIERSNDNDPAPFPTHH
jgi:PAS domain S-box-containing protein